MDELLIQDYFAGMTYDDLCKKYHHKFRTIKKILINHGVDLSDRSRKKYVTDKTLSQETIDEIVKSYNVGKSLNWLCKTFSISKEKVRKILTDNGVVIRQISPHRYTMNLDFFDKIEADQAYILGLFTADGWNRGRDNLLEITLQQSDAQILEDIKEKLELTRELRYFNDSKGWEKVSLTFSSQKIKKVFEEYGIVPNKTFKLLHLPNIHEDYIVHYLRGYFDGDGSASNGFNIVSVNLSFLQDIQQFLYKKCEINPTRIYVDKREEKDNICYSFNYGKKADIEKIYNLIYPEENILCLKRKQNKLKSFIMK